MRCPAHPQYRLSPSAPRAPVPSSTPQHLSDCLSTEDTRLNPSRAGTTSHSFFSMVQAQCQHKAEAKQKLPGSFSHSLAQRTLSKPLFWPSPASGAGNFVPLRTGGFLSEPNRSYFPSFLLEKSPQPKLRSYPVLAKGNASQLPPGAPRAGPEPAVLASSLSLNLSPRPVVHQKSLKF